MILAFLVSMLSTFAGLAGAFVRRVWLQLLITFVLLFLFFGMGASLGLIGSASAASVAAQDAPSEDCSKWELEDGETVCIEEDGEAGAGPSSAPSRDVDDMETGGRWSWVPIIGGSDSPDETRETVGLELDDDVTVEAVAWSTEGGYARFLFSNSGDGPATVRVSDSVQIGSVNSGQERANAREFEIPEGKSERIMGLQVGGSLIGDDKNMKVVISGSGGPYVMSNPDEPLVESVTGWTVAMGTAIGAISLWTFGEVFVRVRRWWANATWSSVI